MPAIEQNPQDRSASSEEGTLYVGRQPILNKDRAVYAYELLYRSGDTNAANVDDGDRATMKTIDSTLHGIGLQDLCGGHPVFVNITRRVLLDELYAALPPKRVVLELLENIEPEADVVAACRRMQSSGYDLALDDFVFRPGFEPLLAIARYVKIDYLATSPGDRRRIVRDFARPELTFIAEKVEEHAQFQEALQLGYGLFQGYFFAKPTIIKGRLIPASKRSYTLLLQEAGRKDLNYDALERIMRGDASLSVRLLRYINSAGMGVREKITSLKQALVLLGEKAIRKWASLVTITCLGHDKPSETVKLCLIRGQLCELLAPMVGLQHRQLDLFMMGLLSAIDALLDCPLDDSLRGLALADDVRATLLGRPTPLRPVYSMVLCWERGEWDQVTRFAEELKLPPARLAEVQRAALRWADEISAM